MPVLKLALFTLSSSQVTAGAFGFRTPIQFQTVLIDNGRSLGGYDAFESEFTCALEHALTAHTVQLLG